jgi:hypothetical protein
MSDALLKVKRWWDAIPTWLPVMCIVFGGVTSFAVAMEAGRITAAKIQEDITELQESDRAVAKDLGAIKSDVREIQTDVRWIREALKRG